MLLFISIEREYIKYVYTNYANEAKYGGSSDIGEKSEVEGMLYR